MARKWYALIGVLYIRSLKVYVIKLKSLFSVIFRLNKLRMLDVKKHPNVGIWNSNLFSENL
jgi:hypothetical protein